MDLAKLERDCLFQLNVLLWATISQPGNAPVVPVLRDAGYTLVAIEQPLDASLLEQVVLGRTSPQVNPNPVADAVFTTNDSAVCVLLECKPDSFTPQSGRAPQARGMIAAAGSLQQRLPGQFPGSVGEVCFLVPLAVVSPMDESLIQLAGEVTSQGIRACATGPIGISAREDGAYLGLPVPSRGSGQMSGAIVPEKRVITAAPGQDPRPLYIVPWIPSVDESTDLLAFREKLRARLLGWIGRSDVGGSVAVSYDDLLAEVSNGAFNYWRDRDSLRGPVFSEVSRTIQGLAGKDKRITVGRTSVKILLDADADRAQVMEKIRTNVLPPKLPEGVQLSLET